MIGSLERNFSRYHKYTLGTELRDGSRRVLQRVIEANESRDRAPVLESLRREIEGLKVIARLAQESGAFASTRAYLHVAEQVVGIARQNEGWLRKAQKTGGRKAGISSIRGSGARPEPGGPARTTPSSSSGSWNTIW